jgi:hypothetical protein
MGLPTIADWTIDPTLISRDSMDMEMRCPNWKDHPCLPYFWAILIFLCSRAVVALGLVFSQKYLPIATDVWSAGPFWYHQLLQWDSEWYFKIVTEGYRYSGDPTIPQNILSAVDTCPSIMTTPPIPAAISNALPFSSF